MLSSINNCNVNLACGYTDICNNIIVLVALVTKSFTLDAFSNSLFVFRSRLEERVAASLPSVGCAYRCSPNLLFDSMICGNYDTVGYTNYGSIRNGPLLHKLRLHFLVLTIGQ
jgi:IS66 Orf2 like protein